MATPLTCIAIDDEPLALDVITKFCERLGDITVTTYSDPAEGLDAIMQTCPDIAFLDIEMENVTGLDIAARLPQGTCFIFTTAYLDYALKGFELDAVDYLHKPFAYDRFTAAIDKARRRLGHSRADEMSQSITVKQEYNNVNIPLADIRFIEAMEGYCKIFREPGGCIVSRVILKNLGAMLPERHFIRIHRSYIVPVARIKSYTRQEVRLVTGEILPVGRQYAPAVISRLRN